MLALAAPKRVLVQCLTRRNIAGSQGDCHGGFSQGAVFKGGGKMHDLLTRVSWVTAAVFLLAALSQAESSE